MSTVMTDFVRQMNTDAPGPSEELFGHTWQALRGLLSAEMRRRSNWQSPPAFLGVVGHAYWTIPGIDADALDELVAECFEFVFIRRWSSLHDQAQRKTTVDGLITLAVRHFLLHAQRQSDPLGFRIFEVLRRTAAKAIDEGVLVRISGESKIRNDTLLAGSADADPERIRSTNPSELADRWAQDHLDGLVTATHADLTRLIRQLVEDLKEWLNEDRPGFRFGDLAAQLKQTCRQAWATYFLGSGLASDGLQQTPTQPDARVEALERFSSISHCVKSEIQQSNEMPKTRRYLDKLWAFLEAYVDDSVDLEALAGLKDDAELSARKLSQVLHIPRERIPELLKLLNGWFNTCRAHVTSSSGTLPMAGPSDPNSPQSRTFAAISAAHRDRIQASNPANDDWQKGDILSLGSDNVPGVYWWVLDADHKSGIYGCVAVDTYPFVGPKDVPFEVFGKKEGPDEPWVARLEFEHNLTRLDMESARRVAHLEIDRASLSSVDLEGFDRVDDTLPAYAEWIEEGPALAHSFLSSKVVPFRGSPSGTGPRYRPALAAILALAVLGLAGYLHQLRSTVDMLSQPILGLPYGEVEFDPDSRGPKTLSIPEDATHVQVGLILSRRLPDFELYRIELIDSHGTAVYRSPDLTPRDSYSLTFPVARLDEKGMKFRLYGLRDGISEILDERELKLEKKALP